MENIHIVTVATTTWTRGDHNSAESVSVCVRGACMSVEWICVAGVLAHIRDKVVVWVRSIIFTAHDMWM